MMANIFKAEHDVNKKNSGPSQKLRNRLIEASDVPEPNLLRQSCQTRPKKSLSSPSAPSLLSPFAAAYFL
jgi:hypothetical protein